MTRTLFVFAALLAFSATATAAELDTASTEIVWRGSKITGKFHDGDIAAKSSAFTMKDGAIASGEIVFDMNSITVRDMDEKWGGKLIAHLKNEDFFDVPKYPTSTLKIDSYKNGKMAGTLTVMGKTQPISFDAKREGSKYTGKATFDRTQFGITYKSGNFFKDLGDKIINDEIEITFAMTVKD